MIPATFNFATDVVDRWAADPGKLALHWVDQEGTVERKRSFAQVSLESTRVARALLTGSIGPGQRVLVLVGRKPEWWTTMVGLIRAGVVACPGTVQLSAKDIAYRARAARATGIIADAACAERVDAVRGELPELRWFLSVGGPRAGWLSYADLLADSAPFTPVPTKRDDLCLIYFTSGTTGPPKMVAHTHVSYPLGHVVTGRDWIGLLPDDLHWNLSDTGWAKAAWSSLFGPWSQGSAVFVQEPEPKFDPRKMLETLSRYPITTLCAPPTAFRQLVTLDLAGHGLERLRQVVSAGEPLNPEVIHAWQAATGTTIRDGYGQTESTILIGNFPGRPMKAGSMGMPAPGFQIAVVDENLESVPYGHEGEIAVRVRPERPLGLFAGYEDNAAENSLKFRGDWYLTSDRAIRDADGYFWFVGRADDVILSGGYRIGPFEVESAVIEHPAVLEAAVVASPDPDRYQVVKAFIVLRPGHAPTADLARDIQAHVKMVTAPYKYPREIEFVDSLPKTISGKILRGQLRHQEAARKSPRATGGTT